MVHNLNIRLTSFTGSFGSIFYEWYESRKYPVFFRGLDGFYSQELFQQLPQLLQSHVYVIINDDKPIGSIIVHGWNRTARSCSVGIMLTEENQNSGLCALALNEVGNILFRDKNIQKVSINFVKSDEKILHMAEKFGLKKEGEFERECFVEGEYKTTVSYAYFAEMWRGHV